VEPLIPNIVGGIYQAYSIAVASIFQIGVVTTVGALLVAFVMRELPLRTSAGHGQSAARDPRVEGQPAGAV
jgi:hypothetical protein